MFHNYRQLPQIEPARAKKKVEVHELNQGFERMIWEQKIDGERFVIQSHMPTPQFLHGITSRCESKVTGRLTEKTDRVPHLANHPELPENSAFDCEFVSSGDIILLDLPGKFWDKLMYSDHLHMRWLKAKFGGALPVYPHVLNTSSILGSLADEAIRKQNEKGKIWAYCFDLIRVKGKDAKPYSQESRRNALATLLDRMDPENGLILMPAWHSLTVDEIADLFYLVTDLKGEGLIAKNMGQPYNGPQNWWKLKRDYPADVVLTGNCKVGEQGKTGQMLGMAASLEIGVYKGDELLPIGWVSAIMDGMHNLVPADQAFSTFSGKVIECRHNGLQKVSNRLGYTMRHPRFRRWREDKSAKDCKIEHVIEEGKIIS